MTPTLNPSTTGSRRLSQLRNELDRVFDDMAGATTGRGDAGWRPAADVVETDAAFRIDVDLPGFDRDDIQVTVNEGVLTVEGRRTLPGAEDGRSYHLRERASGRFSRSFSLPTSIDPNEIEARFDAGVLRITLPKEERAKTRKIEVEVG